MTEEQVSVGGGRFLMYASNESKSVLARDLDDCREQRAKVTKCILSRFRKCFAYFEKANRQKTKGKDSNRKDLQEVPECIQH